MKIIRLAALFVLFFVFSGCGFIETAGISRATVEGRIEGLQVSVGRVKLISDDTGAELTATVSGTGSFVLNGVPFGDYGIEIEGVLGVTWDPLTVTVNGDIRDLLLDLESEEETGELVVQIDWPPRLPTNSLIPDSTEAIRITVSGADYSPPVVGSAARPSDTTPTELRLDIPSGSDRTVFVEAINAAGVQVARGTTITDIQPQADNAVSVTLERSTGTVVIVIE